MQQIKKNKNIILLILFTIVFFAIPSFSQAQTPSTQTFCEKLPKLEKQMSGQGEVFSDEFKAKKTEITELLKNLWADRDAKRLKIQSEAENKQSVYFTKIETKADTEIEKEAVYLYETNIKNALALRKTKTENSIDVYRKSVDTMWDNIKDEDSIKNFNTSLKSNFSNTKSDCAESNRDEEKIRQNFLDRLVESKDKLKKEFNPNTFIKNQITIFQQTKNDSIEESEQEFKTTLEKEKEKLLEAFS